MYDNIDKRDADQLEKWLKENRVARDTSVHNLLEETPRFISESIKRLSFRHMEITVDDLLDLCKRVKDA